MAEPHRLPSTAPGSDHQQPVVQRGRESLLDLGRGQSGGEPAAGSARPGRPGTPSPPAAPGSSPASARRARSAGRPRPPGRAGGAARRGSHAQPSAAGGSSPSWRSALSSSTVSYGLPLVRGAISRGQLGRPLAGPGAACRPPWWRGSAAGRLPSCSRRGPACCRRHRASIGASGWVASTSLVPVGADQQQPFDSVLAAEHRVDEAQRGAPGPLQVVDEEHHRPFRGRRPPAGSHSRVALRPYLRGQRIARVGRDLQQRRELRHHRGRAGRRWGPAPAGCARVRRPAPPPARPAAAGPAPGTPAVPRRTPGPGGTGRTCPPRTSRRWRSRSAAARRPARSCPPRAPPLTSTPRQRPAQAAANAAASVGDLVVAADQPRRWQQPQREVVLADAGGAGRPSRSRARSWSSPSAVWYRLSGSFSSRCMMIADSAAGTAGFDLGRRGRHPGQVIVDEPQRVAGPERRRAGGQLVQGRAQRVQVGALVDRAAGAAGLLRAPDTAASRRSRCGG